MRHLVLHVSPVIPGKSIRVVVLDGVYYFSTKDIVMALCNKPTWEPATEWARLSSEQRLFLQSYAKRHVFEDASETHTQVLDMHGTILLIMMLGGQHAERYKSELAMFLIRWYREQGGEAGRLQGCEAGRLQGFLDVRGGEAGRLQGVLDDRCDESEEGEVEPSPHPADHLALTQTPPQPQEDPEELHRRHIRLQMSQLDVHHRGVGMYRELCVDESIDYYGRTMLKENILRIISIPCEAGWGRDQEVPVKTQHYPAPSQQAYSQPQAYVQTETHCQPQTYIQPEPHCHPNTLPETHCQPQTCIHTETHTQPQRYHPYPPPIPTMYSTPSPQPDLASIYNRQSIPPTDMGVGRVMPPCLPDCILQSPEMFAATLAPSPPQYNLTGPGGILHTLTDPISILHTPQMFSGPLVQPLSKPVEPSENIASTQKTPCYIPPPARPVQSLPPVIQSIEKTLPQVFQSIQQAVQVEVKPAIPKENHAPPGDPNRPIEQAPQLLSLNDMAFKMKIPLTKMGVQRGTKMALDSFKSRYGYHARPQEKSGKPVFVDKDHDILRAVIMDVCDKSPPPCNRPP